PVRGARSLPEGRSFAPRERSAGAGSRRQAQIPRSARSDGVGEGRTFGGPGVGDGVGRGVHHSGVGDGYTPVTGWLVPPVPETVTGPPALPHPAIRPRTAPRGRNPRSFCTPSL